MRSDAPVGTQHRLHARRLFLVQSKDEHTGLLAWQLLFANLSSKVLLETIAQAVTGQL